MYRRTIHQTPLCFFHNVALFTFATVSVFIENARENEILLRYCTLSPFSIMILNICDCDDDQQTINTCASIHMHTDSLWVRADQCASVCAPCCCCIQEEIVEKNKPKKFRLNGEEKLYKNNQYNQFGVKAISAFLLLHLQLETFTVCRLWRKCALCRTRIYGCVFVCECASEWMLIYTFMWNWKIILS